MSRNDVADIFAPRHDSDWEMFCRAGTGTGHRRAGDEDAPWVEVTSRVPTLEPVRLAPDEDASGAHAASAGEPSVRHLYAKVVGLPYPNEDGTSRRDVVRRCTRGEVLRL